MTSDDNGTIEDPVIAKDEPVLNVEPELVHPRIDQIEQFKEDMKLFFNALNITTTAMAEEIRIVREPMVGKGVNPPQSALVVYKLQQIENSLRALASRYPFSWLQ